jgi:hypothetical protein
MPAASGRSLAELLVLAALLPLPAEPAAAQGLAQDRQPVAVLELSVAGAAPGEAARITQGLREALAAIGRFAPLPPARPRAGAPVEDPAEDCGEPECAAEVGRRLGVPWVVVGQGTRVPPRAWQLAVQLVEADAGRTMRTRTLYLEGALEALLSDGIPRLARGLSGESEDVPVAAPTSSLPEPRPLPRHASPGAPPGAQVALRLALLPAWVEGPLREQAQRSYREQAARLAEAEPDGHPVVIAHAPFALPGATPLPNAGGVAERLWLGSGMNARPHLPYARQMGRTLGVQAVLVLRVVATPRESAVQAWVIDVASGEVVLEAGRASPERLGDALRERARRAVRIYLERYLPLEQR